MSLESTGFSEMGACVCHRWLFRKATSVCWAYAFNGSKFSIATIYLRTSGPSGKGQNNFEGQLILFGSDEFPDWSSVTRYFKYKIESWA